MSQRPRSFLLFLGEFKHLLVSSNVSWIFSSTVGRTWSSNHHRPVCGGFKDFDISAEVGLSVVQAINDTHNNRNKYSKSIVLFILIF